MAETNASKSTAKTKKTAKKAVKKKAATKKTTTAKKAKTVRPEMEKSSDTTKTTTARKSAKTAGAKKARLAVESGTAADQKRYTLIQQTAYYIAEKRGFVGGDPEHDWLMAEKQVDEMLKRSST